jgi:GT2 family glycosyltransferase
MGKRCAVIVLNYNGKHLLSACLDSLALQQNADLEVIIVDNNSSDGSAAFVAEKYPKVKFLALDKNYGFSGANNFALRDALARGFDFAMLLNNDTFADPHMVAEMIATMETDPRVAVVCPKIFFASRPDMIWYAGGGFNFWTGRTQHRGWKQIDRGQFDDKLDITQATGCAMMVRCSAMRKAGLLDEQFFMYAEDTDWSLRFAELGYLLRFAPKARVWHIDGATTVKLVGKGSESLRQFLSTRNMVFVARKHARWWQIPTYAIVFGISHVALFTALRLWRRDFPALWAIYRGLFQGLQTRLEGAAGGSKKIDSMGVQTLR